MTSSLDLHHYPQSFILPPGPSPFASCFSSSCPSGTHHHTLENHWGGGATKRSCTFCKVCQHTTLCLDGIYLPQPCQVHVWQLLKYLASTFMPFAGQPQCLQCSTEGERPTLPCVAKVMEVSRNSLRSLMKGKDFGLPM